MQLRLVCISFPTGTSSQCSNQGKNQKFQMLTFKTDKSYLLSWMIEQMVSSINEFDTN